MTNNLVLSKIQAALNLSIADLQNILALASVTLEVPLLTGYSTASVRHKDYVPCPNSVLHAFLNGLIIHRRGVSEKTPADATPSNTALENNDILKKLRIAMNMQNPQVITAFIRGCAELECEVTALFRRKGHKHYKKCSDENLEAFIKGMVLL